MTWLGNWVRVALIDLRGDVRRFAILLACLALGVGTIAAVGSVGAALQSAVDRDARVILGGDLEVRLQGRDATPEEAAAFAALGAVTRVVELSARAGADGKSAFLNLRAVDQAYPLAGAVETGPETAGMPLPELLAERDGLYGAVLDAQVFERLGIALGDTLSIGNSQFAARGVLVALPDQAAQGFQFGQPALIATEALAGAGLNQQGVLTRHRYKIALEGLDFAAARDRLDTAFPDAPWEIRSPQDATENLTRFFGLFARFLTLVGLSSLLVGGVGVSNAVSAYITERQGAIATLRSLGATSARIMVHFFTQIMVLSLIGIALGLLLGGASTLIALPVLSGMLAIELPPSLDLASLLGAAGFGALIAFAFAFLPLRRAQALRPAILFRAAGGGFDQGPGWRTLLNWRTAVPLALALAAIGGLAVLTTGQPRLVLWYGIGAAVAFGLLRLAAFILQHALRLVPAWPSAILRQAFKAIYRPGAPAPIVILSLGLGLALLLLIALLDGNLRGQINGAIAEEAPSFILLDMKPDTLAALESFASTEPRIESLSSVSMLRGTVVSIKGKPVAELGPLPEDIADMFRGDTALSWARDLPEGSTLADGTWWAPDYAGSALVSLSTELVEPLGLAVGDEMVVSVLGRPITARIASFREIDWRSANLSFRILFSPGLIEKAPQSFMGSIKAQKGTDAAIESALGQQFPTLNFLPVGDALNRVADILASLANAVALVGSLAVISGVFVLAGAMAVGRRQREADAMVMKVLGASRAGVIVAFVVEYGLLGLLSALLAAALGVTGAWAILTYVLEIPFVLDLPLVGLVTLGAVLLTILTGVVTTWSAMSVRPARRLRSELS
jgi:putative ABC transport system permease protein